MSSPTPSPTASPLAAAPGATPPKTLYVVTAFEAVSELGTHQFPVGAEVNVMEEDGDDYLVEYHGVAVRNGKEFFSETWSGEAAPTPVTADASPLASPESAAPPAATSSPEPLTTPESGLAAPNATPDPQMAAEEEKSAELLGEIRTLNEEIRQAEEAQQRTTTSDSQGGDSTKIKQLKKQRDALSEDLTDFAKP